MKLRKKTIIRLAGVLFACFFMQMSAAHGEDIEDLMLEIKSLREEVRENAREVQRAKDVNEIQNLINKWFYQDEACMFEEVLGHVAQKTSGVSIEISGRGVFEGYESARRTLVDTEEFYLDLHAKGMKKTYPELELDNKADGFMVLYHTGSPVIEVAGDGKTAKGVWSTLMLTSKTYDMVAAPEAKWMWYKIAADFVKENGEWKVWHYYRQPRFGIQSYYASLAGGPPGVVAGGGSVPGGDTPGGVAPGSSPPGAAPAGDTSGGGPGSGGAGAAGGIPAGDKTHGTYYDRPSSKAYRSGYSLTNSPHYWPEPPEPYETFDEDSAYVYPSLPQEQRPVSPKLR